MRKGLKIVISIVSVLVILVGITYLIDMNRMNNNKPVVFSTWGYDYAPPVSLDFEIIDKTIDSNIACADALEKFYEDDENEYYFPCIKSENVIVKFEEGNELGIVEALKNKVVTITDLDRHNIKYYTEKKIEGDKQAIYNQGDKFLSLTLPKDWNFEIVMDSGDTGECGIKFYYTTPETFVTLYYYKNKFGVCGTGLTSDEMKLNNGKSVNVGYYDNHEYWAFTTFEDNIVALNNGLKGEEAKTALEILKTIKYGNDVEKLNDKENKYSFIGKIIEANETNYLIEPNIDEEIRKSADKISISIDKNSDSLYMVGSTVKITYDGDIMETYPAKVNVAQIEVLNSNFDKEKDTFELEFEKVLNQGKQIIFEAKDYKVYSFNGNVNLKINETSYTLKEALNQNKIAMEDIIEKANADIRKNEEIYNNKPKYQSMPALEPYQLTYRDGGSIEYHYGIYTIIKCHRIDGNRDVYICDNETSLNDLGL